MSNRAGLGADEVAFDIGLLKYTLEGGPKGYRIYAQRYVIPKVGCVLPDSSRFNRAVVGAASSKLRNGEL